MPDHTMHRTFRCSHCDMEWPALPAYNLCPKCERCTWASTTDTQPSQSALFTLAQKHIKFREQYNKIEKARDAAAQQEIDELDTLFALPPNHEAREHEPFTNFGKSNFIPSWMRYPRTPPTAGETREDYDDA